MHPADSAYAMAPGSLIDENDTLPAGVVPRAAFDELARLVAHEVRNALSPLRVAAQTALTTPNDGADLAALAERVFRAVDRVSVITEALLDRHAGRPSRIDANDLVRDASDACSTGNIVLRSSPGENERPIRIRTYGAALHHILANLLANAARASAGGGASVEVEVRRSTWNTERGTVRGAAFSVVDHGPGLPRSALDRLNASSQEDLGQTFGVGGVGIEVVRRLASLIGARVEARNVPSGGACVTVFVPDLAEASSSAAA